MLTWSLLEVIFFVSAVREIARYSDDMFASYFVKFLIFYFHGQASIKDAAHPFQWNTLPCIEISLLKRLLLVHLLVSLDSITMVSGELVILMASGKPFSGIMLSFQDLELFQYSIVINNVAHMARTVW